VFVYQTLAVGGLFLICGISSCFEVCLELQVDHIVDSPFT